MFNSITNFIADVKAGYVAARDEAYTSATTVYDSKVKQYTHNAAVAVLKAWKWFYTQCAKAHETIRSCVAKSRCSFASRSVGVFPTRSHLISQSSLIEK